MNCAWCGANNDGSDSHGICNDCIKLHFGVRASDIYDEVVAEFGKFGQQDQEQQEKGEVVA